MIKATPRFSAAHAPIEKRRFVVVARMPSNLVINIELPVAHDPHPLYNRRSMSLDAHHVVPFVKIDRLAEVTSKQPGESLSEKRP
jgi:hypothetical protein